MSDIEKLAAKLKPIIIGWGRTGNTAQGTYVSPTEITPHALSGAFHTGTALRTQVPWAASIDELTEHAAVIAAHGALGAVVGTENTQTLINKTLTTPIIASFTNAQHSHANAAGGGQIAHTNLTSIGTNTHAQIDTHIATADTHVAHSDVTMTAGDGLTGGGTIAATRTFSVSLSATSGLELTGTSPNKTLQLADSVAGDGLAISSKVLAVGVANTIQSAAASGLSVEANAIRFTASHMPGANASPLASDATGKLTLPLFVASTSINTPSLISPAATELAITSGADTLINPGGVVKLGTGKLIRSSGTFTSGFAGSGWQIDDGVLTAGRMTATFDDLVVRGTMRVYELLIQQIRATNGSVFVSSAAKLESATLVSGVSYTCIVDGSTTDYQPFAVGDVLRAQRVSLGTTSVVWKSDLVVTAINTGGNQRAFTANLIGASTPPAKGMEFVRLGNTSDVARQGAVYITADDSGAPFIDVVNGITAHADWNTAGKVKVRLGRLDGVTGNANEYGLWAGNTSSSILASTAGVTVNNVPLRFQAGSSTVVMEMAPGNSAPYLALGSPLPTGPMSENGIWAGLSEATTNLFTNPSFETNTTGLATYNTGTPTGTRARSTDFAKFGAYSYKIDKTGGAAQSDRYGVYNSVSVVSGQTYTFSVWVKVSAISGGLERVWIQASTNVTTALAYIYGVSDWQRVVITTTATGTGSARLYVAADNCDTATIYVDGFQCENRATATEYCDGSLGADYAWTGTAHASTSTRNGGYKLRVGEVSGGTLVKGLYWNGTDLIWKATNTSLDASGNLTATNATLTGTITADLGAIGGWTIASTGLTATNIGLYSGAANTARLQVGTGSNVAGVNSVAAGTDIAFWAGDTHANRTAAEFRVRADGQLYATGATLSGAITATSGTITGDFDVTSGGKLTAGSGGVLFDVSGQAIGLYPNIDGGAAPPDTAKAIAWYDTPTTRTGLQARQYVGKATDSTPHWNVTVNPNGSAPLTMSLWWGGASLNSLWFTNLANVTGLPALFLAGGITPTAQVQSGSRLQLNSGSEFLASTHLKAGTTNTYDLGEAGVKWRKLYVGEVIADTVSGGTALGGNTWQRADAGDMYIYSFSEANNRTLYVANPGAGTMSLDVEGGITLGGSITLGGTVDGVDLSAFKTAYDSHNHDGRYYTETELQTSGSATVHWGNISSKPSTFAPSAHALVGADHTASGLTTGHVIRASGVSSFAWAQLAHSDLSGVGTNSHATIDSHIAATAAHGATGAVVGTTNTQTLTNKTLTTPTIGDFTNAQHAHTGASSGGTIAHGSLTGVGANDHHNQSHVLASTSGLGADHTVAGLTARQVLRATGATTAAFGAIEDADLPSTIVRTSRQVIAGNGLTGGGALSSDVTVTLGTPSTLTVSSTNAVTSTSHTHAITSSSNPGASASLLSTTAGGLLTLANLATTGAWYKTGTVYQYYEVAEFSTSGNPTTGTIKITLPKLNSSTMMVLRIVGFQYTSATTYGRGGWEAIVSGYNSSGWASAGHQVVLHGEAPFSQVRLCDDGANSIILLGDTGSQWYYPKISVAYAMMGHSNLTGWETGWSITAITDETGITTRRTPAIYHAPPDSRALTAGNGLTGGGDLSADRTFTLGTPSALSATSTDAVTTTSHTHSIDSTIARSAITITAGDGLTGGGNLTANRTVTLGTPSSLTATTTNAVTTTSHTHAITTGVAVGLSVSSTSAEGSGASIARADHTHAITTSSNPGVAASILASDASGNLNLQGLYIRGTRAIPSVLQLRSTTNDSSWATNDLLGAIEFYSQDASSPGQGVKAAIRAVHVGTATSLPQTGLVFTTNSDTETMWINDLGNVGIGKSPDVRLSVFNGSQNIQARFGWTTTAGLDPLIRFTGRNEADSSSRHADIQLDSEGYLNLFAPSTTAPTTKAIIIDSTGKVGINGVTPTSTLHVSGTGKFTGSVDSDVQFLGQAADTVSAPSFSWTSDTNTGLWRPAADTLSITTGGTEVARFAVRDIAFFNSTLEPWSTNYRGLQLGAYGSIMTAETFNAGYGLFLIYNAYYNTSNSWRYQNSNPAIYYRQGSNGHTWNVAPTGSADAALTWTAAMTLDLNSKLTVTGDLAAGGTIYADGGILDFGSDYFEEDGTYLQLKGAKPFTLNQTLRAASWNITTAGAATLTDVIAPSVRAGASTELVIGAGADIQLNPTGVVKLASGKLVRSSTFTSGFAGNGWQIDDGVITAGRISAEFDDLTIRGRLRVYELLIQQIRATNGSVFVTSTGKAKTVSGGPSSFTITTDTADNHGFLVGDLIRAQRFTGSGVYQSDLQVTAVANLYTFTATKIAGDDPASGMDFVRLGSTSDASRRGSVYLTADDSGAPFIDIVDGINSHSAWNSRTADAGVKARIGRITGITGNANEYGIWAGSGTGNTAQSLVASSAGITLNNAPINFRAGSSTIVMQLSPGAGNASPSLAMGSALPTAPLTGDGLWMGKDGSDYEFRVGTVSGGVLTKGVHWNGSALNIKGSTIIGPGGGFTVANATLHLKFDAAKSSPLQVNVNGHLGQVATIVGNVIGEAGKFGGAARLRPSGTNYISNPSFEGGDTSYWSTYTGGVMTSVTTDSVYGSSCGSFAVGASSNPYFYRANLENGPALATGQTWTFSLYVKAGNAGAVGKNVTVYLRENASGAHQTTTVVQATGAWQRVVVTRTLTQDTPTSLNHYVTVTSSGGSGDVFLFDSIQLEQTGYASPYIDSTMPNVVLSGTNHLQAAESRLAYNARQTVPLTGSLSMWVKPVNTGGSYVTFFRYSGAAGHLILRAQPSSSSWQGYWGTTVRTSAASAVQWDTWQHIAVTGDGTNTRVYVNGALVASGTSGTPLSYHASASASVGYNVSAEAACGWVDDLVITETLLSDDDIAQMYASGLPVHCPSNNFELELSSGSNASIVGHSGGLFAVDESGNESFALANSTKVWGTRYSGGSSLEAGDLVLGDPDQQHLMYDASAASLLIGKGANENVSLSAAGLEFRNSSTVVGSLSGTTLTLGQTGNPHTLITSISVQMKSGANVHADLTGSVLTLGLTSTGDYLTVDGTNGVRIYANANIVGHWKADGSLVIGRVANSNSRIEIASGAISIINRSAGGADATAIGLDASGNATFTGAISGGTIDIGGADTTSFHVDATGQMWLGDAAYASAPFKVSAAGAITATSGTVGGWTIGATLSATNLVLTPGAANTAHILAGTGATAGGINSAAASGDVVFWAGSTFANRATANFTVTAGGSITAKAGTVGGWALGTDDLTGGNVYLHDTGYIRIGAGTGDRLWLSATDATYRLWVGNDTAASAPVRIQKTGAFHFGSATRYLSFDGTDIAWAGVNTSLTTAGLFTAANANITGAIDANSGTIGTLTVDGALTIGTGGRISSGATAWGTGDGFWFEHNSGNPRVRIGTAAGNRLLFETTTGILTIFGNGSGITSISGSNITTGTLSADRIGADSITADKINVATLSALTADMGTLTTGSIVIGSTNKIWLNDSADGALALGGSVKGSAPFQVSNTGILTATGATVTGTIQATAGYIGNTDGWNIGAGEIMSVSSGATAMRMSALGASPFLALGATAAPGLWMGDGLWIGQEEATTNLVSNPSFETNTTSWSNYSNGTAAGTRTRVTTHALAGTYSYELIKTGGGTTDRWGITRTRSVTAGEVLTFSAWIKITAITGGNQAVRINCQNNITNTSAYLYGTGDWRRVSITATATATGTASFYIWIDDCTTATIYVDAVQLENKAYATPYIDGSMATGTWDGTAHASASSRTAATRARMGTVANNALTAGWSWDGAALNVVGAITATSGSITGALTIGASGGIYQGTGTFASPTTGLKIWNESGVGRIGGYNAGTAQWYAGTDGKLYAGGGNTILDANGVNVVSSTSTFEQSKAYTFSHSGVSIGGLASVRDANTTTLLLKSNSVADDTANNAAENGRSGAVSISGIGQGTGKAGVVSLTAQMYTAREYPASLYLYTPYSGDILANLTADKINLYGETYLHGGARVGADPGGAASTLTLTNSTGAAGGAGTGTVKMNDSTNRNNNGFIKMYIGTTAIFVPYWTTIAG